ncbi:13274_t:CDS:2 [Funneliformis geosporum]|uniref:16454_t:CDS:1 n=1 Tax=Funneliformis geosporum TaxID=1117311 RepID=A0A9W4SMV7_9GLOM|nr:16454_t:CDS:2 [Funneliformis geosporum]CAI2183845.1 13274_t:CDS:2 [Funneliformis geosporum]
MVLGKYPILFRTLKFLTILTTLAIIASEITQYKAFTLYSTSDTNNIIHEFPDDYYQNSRSNLYGIKIFFYIILILTIIINGIQFVKFNMLWREGPSIRDIVFGGGFAIVWIIAGLVNVFAYYYAPELTCPGYSKKHPTSQIPWELQLKCKLYLSITALAWLNVVIFFLSTALYWKLWINRNRETLVMP